MELTDTPIFFSGLFLSSYTHTQTFFRDSIPLNQIYGLASAVY